MTRHLWLLALLLGACGDTRALDEPIEPDEGGLCRLASVQSDYTSTRVSLLDAEGRLCRAGVLHSGSAPPGLSTALSGDVVLGGVHPDGVITVLDRYPNGVITWLDPVDFSVLGQLGVNTGFAANPQDVAYVSRTRAYVSRLETNPRGGYGAYDGGGDLLVIDPERRAITGRINLNPWGGADIEGPLRPRPGRLAQAADHVWVPLHRLSEDFTRGGSALLLGVEPLTGEIAHVVDLTPLKNCTAIAPSPSGRGVWLGCTGVFLEGAEAQLLHSGVAYVEPGAPTRQWMAPARSWLQGRPAGLSIAPIDDTRAFVTVISHPDAPQPDGLVLVDRDADAGQPVTLDARAFELGEMWYDAEARRLLVPDGDPTAPRVLRFAVDGATLTPLPPTDPDPAVGLPPRAISPYR